MGCGVHEAISQVSPEIILDCDCNGQTSMRRRESRGW